MVFSKILLFSGLKSWLYYFFFSYSSLSCCYKSWLGLGAVISGGRMLLFLFLLPLPINEFWFKLGAATIVRWESIRGWVSSGFKMGSLGFLHPYGLPLFFLIVPLFNTVKLSPVGLPFLGIIRVWLGLSWAWGGLWTRRGTIIGSWVRVCMEVDTFSLGCFSMVLFKGF